MPRSLQQPFAAALLAAGCVVTCGAHAQTQETWYESAWHTLRDPAAPTWYEGIWKNWSDTFKEGNTSVLLPISTYHLRSAYPPDKIDTYTEWPLGLGLGRSRFDDSGNRREVYAFVYQDSNGRPQYQVGYLWLKNWRPIASAQDFRLGLGYTLFLMAREDSSYIPFPGIIPVAAIGYKGFSLETTYVPGGNGYGNVIFTWAQYTF